MRTTSPRRLFVRRGDGAVSDVIGTAILLAATTGLVTAALVTLLSGSESPEGLPRLDLKASTSPSDPALVVLSHAGGDTLPRSDLRVVVHAGGVAHRDGDFPGSGAWSLGESARVNLDRAAAPGERLEAMVVSRALGAVIATAPVEAVGAASAASSGAGFTLVVTSPASSPVTELLPGATLKVVASVAHAEGRKAVLGASVNMSELDGSPVVPLHDDGTHGDALAGDLEFTTYIVIPPGATAGLVQVPVHATAIDGSVTPDDPAALLVFRVLPPANPGPPGIGSFTPASGIPNTKVTVTGVNLSYTNSMSFVDALTGAAFGATWWLGDDRTLYVLPPPTAVFDRDYNISVTTPQGSVISVDTFRIVTPTGIPLAPPTMTGFDPASGKPGSEVAVLGTGFAFATSVTLSSGASSYAAPFWNVGVAGTELHFLVPRGVPEGDYTLSVFTAAGVATSACCAPDKFTILPPDPLRIDGVAPGQGEPYTPITITGAGFLNAVAVTMALHGGPTASTVGVSYWIVSDTELRIITHAGVTVGDNNLTVYNGTGRAVHCCFNALPAPEQPEVHVYPKSLFGIVGHNTTKVRTSSAGDVVRAQLKFDLLTDDTAVGSETYSVEKVTLVHVPFKPGDVGRIDMGAPVCSPADGPGGRVGVWLFSLETGVPNYIMDEDSFRYFFEVTWSNGLSGGRYATSVFYIDSSITTQYFNLRQRDDYKVLLDDDTWPSEFTTCNR